MCRHFNVNCTALRTHTARRHFLQRPLGGAKRAFYHLPHSHLSLFLDCLPSLSVCYKPCNSSLSLNFVAFFVLKPRKKNAPLAWRCNSFGFFWGVVGMLSFFPPSSHQMSCILPFHIHPSDDVIDRRSGLESSLWITWSGFRGEPSDSVAGATTSASGARHPFFFPPPSLTLQLTAQTVTQVQM